MIGQGDKQLVEAIFPFVIIGLVICAIIAGVIYSHLAEKKRTEQVSKVANQLGLPFFEEGDPALLRELDGFKLFSKGRARTITNMVHGEADGVDLGLFDYRYTIGGGKNSQTLRQSVVYIRAKDLQLPEFALGPENFLHRIGSMLGMQDIDFDEHPKFSRTFLLRGPDEAAVRTLFTPERIHYMEEHPTLSIEGQGDQLAVFYHAQRHDPEKLSELMSTGFEIYSKFRADA